MQKYFFILLTILSLSLTSCLTQSTKSGAVGIERKQLLLVSSSQMNTSAEKSYTQILTEARKNHTLNTNKKTLRRVRTIAKNLIKHVDTFRADAKHWKWESNIITSDELNAWCMPGGKIMFYTGIIDTLTLTDDEIAAIMGHEIAHALREHGRERASQEMSAKLGLKLLGSLFDLQQKTLDLSNLALNTTILLPNSRTHEIEADRMGVELAARAGYNPKAAANVWRKMQKVSKSQPIELLSTHPSHEHRITDLENYAKKVAYLYHRK